MGAALAGLAVLTAMLPAAPAAADHTPVPQAVTLVGSLQEELGCPGDWQPECAATHLQPVDGQPGVFRGTFDVPAGGYDYKVALNDAWSENYGADGSARRCEHPADSARRPGHVHLRPRHPPDRRRLPQAAGQRRRRAVAAPRHHRLGPSRAERGPELPALLGRGGRTDPRGRSDHRWRVRSAHGPLRRAPGRPACAVPPPRVLRRTGGARRHPAADAAHRTGGGRLRRSRWQRRDRDGPATARRPGRPVRRGAQPHPRAHVGLGSAASCAVGADRQVR